MRRTFLAISSPLLAAGLLASHLAPSLPEAAALMPMAAAPPAGISVEAKNAASNRGFDLRFKSDSGAVATLSIDPLGTKHSASGSLGSRGGTVSLQGRFDRNARAIVVEAKRSGQSVGEFRWQVEATLR